MPERKIKAKFVDPMLLLPTQKLPEGEKWAYEIKLDGYRALGIKSDGRVNLRSRNDNDFSLRYPSIAKALVALPNETVVDGEVVALDADGKPSFNTLQNLGSSEAPLFYYIFDVLILSGRNVMRESLSKRRELLESKVLPKLSEPIRPSPQLSADLDQLIASVKVRGLEGLVAKRLDSKYEPGMRSGAWQKMRVNKGQEFVIGGYTPSDKNFDALVIGYYDGPKGLSFAESVGTTNRTSPPQRFSLALTEKFMNIFQVPLDRMFLIRDAT